MTSAVPNILSRIVEHKRQELASTLRVLPELEKQAAERNPADRRDWAGALRRTSAAIIAEVKQASPSKGVLTGDFQPVAVATEYQAGGASCISVLTDREFFRGSLDDLRAVRAAVSLPVIRKDFTIHPAQVIEAAAHGADAILLIAAILTEREMRDFREFAATLGLAALVEVHDEEELAPALASGAEIVGVNNRNLNTFEVSLETSLRLADRMPDSVLRVSESGIRTAADIRALQASGFTAFLIGEHLMRSGDPRTALGELLA